jgi:hypothetical protein
MEQAIMVEAKDEPINTIITTVEQHGGTEGFLLGFGVKAKKLQ